MWSKRENKNNRENDIIIKLKYKDTTFKIIILIDHIFWFTLLLILALKWIHKIQEHKIKSTLYHVYSSLIQIYMNELM